jgi:hypothetical protein
MVHDEDFLAQRLEAKLIANALVRYLSGDVIGPPPLVFLTAFFHILDRSPLSHCSVPSEVFFLLHIVFRVGKIVVAYDSASKRIAIVKAGMSRNRRQHSTVSVVGLRKLVRHKCRRDPVRPRYATLHITPGSELKRMGLYIEPTAH